MAKLYNLALTVEKILCGVKSKIEERVSLESTFAGYQYNGISLT